MPRWLAVVTAAVLSARPAAAAPSARESTAPVDVADPDRAATAPVADPDRAATVPVDVAPADPDRAATAPVDVAPADPDRAATAPLEVSPPPDLSPGPASPDLSPGPASPDLSPGTATPDLSSEPAQRDPPPTDLSPGPAPPPAPTRRHAGIGRLPTYFGLGAGLGLTTRAVGDAAPLAAVTPHGAVHARIAGYAERRARRARRAVVMVLPEVQIDLELGGTAAPSPARHGVMVGASGVLDIGFAFATPGVVGVYTHLHIGNRFRVRHNTDLEGAHGIGAGGLTAGLRVHHRRVFTLLLGGGLDGVVGAHRLLERTRLVAQLVPVAALAVYGETPRDVYVGLTGRFDATAVGARYGGARLHGRATFEVMWRVHRVRRVRLATFLLTYEGTRISADPGHPQFDPLGERRTSHQLLAALGVTI